MLVPATVDDLKKFGEISVKNERGDLEHLEDGVKAPEENNETKASTVQIRIPVVASVVQRRRDGVLHMDVENPGPRDSQEEEEDNGKRGGDSVVIDLQCEEDEEDEDDGDEDNDDDEKEDKDQGEEEDKEDGGSDVEEEDPVKENICLFDVHSADTEDETCFDVEKFKDCHKRPRDAEHRVVDADGTVVCHPVINITEEDDDENVVVFDGIALDNEIYHIVDDDDAGQSQQIDVDRRELTEQEEGVPSIDMINDNVGGDKRQELLSICID